MGFRCGIVGLPNVGKSTIFNALTSGSAAASNYPFCTIEPNVGIVAVPDARLEKIAGMVKTEKLTFTTMEFVDIAGLVQGASKGEGLGNQFLGHIREVDAVAHVVRCFHNENIVHVSGGVDPLRDIETIHTELMLSDLDWIQGKMQRAEKLAKTQKKEAVQEVEVAKKCLDALSQGKVPSAEGLNEELAKVFRGFNLLSAKPVLLVLNVDEAQLKQDDAFTTALLQSAHAKGYETVKICGQIESEIAQLAGDDRQAFLKEMGLQESGLVRLVHKGYELLGLISFFTAGVKETRSWTIPRGAKAPQAAGKIHTDFEKGFIRAEVIGYADYIACGGEAGARAKGLMRIEGKDYVVKDADVMLFRFNV